MRLHGADGNLEFLGDLQVVLALHDIGKNFRLPWGEAMFASEVGKNVPRVGLLLRRFGKRRLFALKLESAKRLLKGEPDNAEHQKGLAGVSSVQVGEHAAVVDGGGVGEHHDNGVFCENENNQGSENGQKGCLAAIAHPQRPRGRLMVADDAVQRIPQEKELPSAVQEPFTYRGIDLRHRQQHCRCREKQSQRKVS